MTKRTKAELRAMIAKNPKVNGAQFERSLKVLRELNKTGIVHKHIYSLPDEEPVSVSRN